MQCPRCDSESFGVEVRNWVTYDHEETLIPVGSIYAVECADCHEDWEIEDEHPIPYGDFKRVVLHLDGRWYLPPNDLRAAS